MQRVRNRRKLLGSSSSESKKPRIDCSKAFRPLERAQTLEHSSIPIPASTPVSSLPPTTDDKVRLPLAASQTSAAGTTATTSGDVQRQWNNGSDARGTVVEKLRDRLDSLRDPRPKDLDLAKCGHELRLGEDVLYFPFPPMPPQCQVAAYAVRACERGGIAMLQSPTGTGKSLALLCSTLAWQRRRLQAVGSAPQILYGVRTHAQLSQIVAELRKSAYRPRMAVIGSRDQLCTNGLVKAQAAQRQVALSLACRQAARQAVSRNRVAGDCGCELYAGLGSGRFAERLHDQCGQGGRIWDVEDLTKVCSRGTDRGCSYYSSHVLAGDADIVFCPHNYILDPAVSKCRSHHRERWSLQGRIIVIDEAHNLEQACREAGSLQISLPELRQICRALRQMPLRHGDMRFGSDGKNFTCAQAAIELERLPEQIASFLEGHQATKTAGPLCGALQRLWGLEASGKPGEAVSPTRDFFQYAGLTSRKLLGKGMEDLVLEAVDRLLQEQSTSETDNTPSPADGASEDAELFAALDKLKGLIFKLRLASQYPECYVVGISPAEGPAQSLSAWLMTPGVLFEIFAGSAHAVLLASGTLTPLSSLQAELADSPTLSSRALPEGPLEALHVVSSKQMLAAVLPCSGNLRLVGTYDQWHTQEFLEELGNCVLQLILSIPGGVLCFLPSYQTLELATAAWKRRGGASGGGSLWRRMEEVKGVLVSEPRGAGKEMSDACTTFINSVRSGHGALALAVYRGKMSEGLDFTDDLCRAVICIGIPYPQVNDPVVLAKRQWNDSRTHKAGNLNGEQWYEQQAYRAINQALGRCLRHHKDFGAVLLLDARWASRGERARGLRKHLAPWLQRHVFESTSCEDLSRRLRAHFEAARMPSDVTRTPAAAQQAARGVPELAAVPEEAQGAPPKPKRRLLDLLKADALKRCVAGGHAVVQSGRTRHLLPPLRMG